MRNLFLLVFLATSAAAQSKCPFANYFGVPGSPDFIVRTSPTVCKSYSQTCCTEEDFKAILTDYQAKVDRSGKESILENVQRRITSVSKAATTLMKDISNIRAAATSFLSSGFTSDECRKAAMYVQTDEKIKSFSSSYIKNFKTCTNTIANIMKTVYCSLCDSNSASFFSAESKTLSFKPEVCKTYLTGCNDLLFGNFDALYPFLENLETMSRCTSNGIINTAVTPLRTSDFLDGNPLADISNCIKADSVQTASCISVCSKGIKFSSEGSYSYPLEDYILAVWKRFADRYKTSFSVTQQELNEIRAYEDRATKKAQGKEVTEPEGDLWWRMSRVKLTFQDTGLRLYPSQETGLKAVDPELIPSLSSASYLARVSLALLSLVLWI